MARMRIKNCFKCGSDKPVTEFYKHKMMADGLLGKCKDCTRKDVIENRGKKLEYYREYDRTRANEPHRAEARAEYSKTPKGIAVAREATRKWAEENAFKRAAQMAAGNAIRDGRLKRQPCEVCGTTVRVQGHHDDYLKPLDVRWLCTKHHGEHHKSLRQKLREAEKAS